MPFTPVPLTGQTFAVLLTAASLGMWRGVASMSLYAVAGLAGVPWFAEGSSAFKSGALTVSFGYILGFIAAAALVGWLAERGATRTAPVPRASWSSATSSSTRSEPPGSLARSTCPCRRRSHWASRRSWSGTC